MFPDVYGLPPPDSCHPHMPFPKDRIQIHFDRIIKETIPIVDSGNPFPFQEYFIFLFRIRTARRIRPAHPRHPFIPGRRSLLRKNGCPPVGNSFFF